MQQIKICDFKLTLKHREAQKKHEQTSGDHEDPHEEHLRVEALVELDDLHGLVEDGVEVEVALGVPVRGQVDVLLILSYTFELDSCSRSKRVRKSNLTFKRLDSTLPVGQVDAETDGAAGEGVGRHERVRHGGLLLRLHCLLVGDRRKVQI